MSTNKATSNLKPRLAPLKSGLFVAVEIGTHFNLLEHSDLPITRTLEELTATRSSFYRWYQKYQEGGYEGLTDFKSSPQTVLEPDGFDSAPSL